MPVHDWSRVPAGIFHDFHQRWASAITTTLNDGRLPEGYLALMEQSVSGPIPDVITLGTASDSSNRNGGVAVADSPPRARFMISAEMDIYAAKSNRIAIHHPLGEVVAVIEIVSPGNKSSRHGLRQFVEKARSLLDQGIHLLVIDLFPPGPRDPQGIHKSIWDEISSDVPFELPADKPLTLASYIGGQLKTAYIEPIAVAEPLPDMPIFLSAERYIPVPLESTYQSTWSTTPQPVKNLLTAPVR